MAGMASINGVVSGMKTDEIIAKIMELERAPITRLQYKKATLTNKLTAWQDMNTRTLALNIKAAALANPNNFGTKSTTSSDEDVLTATASYNADAGTYYMNVTQLAQTHQIKSSGYDDTNITTLGTGTLTIEIDGESKVITVDGTNNTLAGLRDAINRADAGVTASIINDGSADPYKLIITSSTSGADGEITLTNNIIGANAPTFANLQTAQDASVTIGSGGGAITVTKGSNTITDLLPGVTLTLKDAGTSTLIVAHDNSAIRTSIQEFVEQYNNLVDFFNVQFNYDVDTKTSGTLFSDSGLQAIQADMSNRLTDPVSGLDQTILAISQIGISLSADGRLAIDETELDAALADDIDSVRRLFARVGETTDVNVQFVSSTENTQPSSASGYAINITQAATKARVTAGIAQTVNLAADETLTFTKGTTTTVVSLTAGMSQAEVIDKINEYTDETGITASATLIDGTGTGNFLTLKQASYGASHTISVRSSLSNSGGTNTSGIGNVVVTQADFDGEAGTGTGAAGLNVAGTINGEAATGNGQLLTGNADNENTEGLKIRYTGTGTGALGVVRFTRGVAGQLADYINQITTSTGAVMTAQDGLRTEMSGIDEDIAELEARMLVKEDQLIAKFTSMERAMGQFQSQGNWLAGQASNLAKSWRQL